MKIVGDGPNRKMYEGIINKMQISDVEMLGRRNPIPYYREASIFMMTSKSESWGLTLTESQQFGVVPIAFDTYESLRDIITDEDNGIIIPSCDKQSYADAVLDLMKSSDKRQQFAQRAIYSCKRYQVENIIKLWWDLINLK